MPSHCHAPLAALAKLDRNIFTVVEQDPYRWSRTSRCQTRPGRPATSAPAAWDPCPLAVLTFGRAQQEAAPGYGPAGLTSDGETRTFTCLMCVKDSSMPSRENSRPIPLSFMPP